MIPTGSQDSSGSSDSTNSTSTYSPAAYLPNGTYGYNSSQLGYLAPSHGHGHYYPTAQPTSSNSIPAQQSKYVSSLPHHHQPLPHMSYPFPFPFPFLSTPHPPPILSHQTPHSPFLPPQNRFPSSASTSTGTSKPPQGICLYRGCTRQFARAYDLDRHMKVHFPESTNKLDCPYAGEGSCKRVGERGFTRKDHRDEHIRNVHMIDLPKSARGMRNP